MYFSTVWFLDYTCQIQQEIKQLSTVLSKVFKLFFNKHKIVVNLTYLLYVKIVNFPTSNFSAKLFVSPFFIQLLNIFILSVTIITLQNTNEIGQKKMRCNHVTHTVIH